MSSDIFARIRLTLMDVAVVISGVALLSVTWLAPTSNPERMDILPVRHRPRVALLVSPDSVATQAQRLLARNPFGLASDPPPLLQSQGSSVIPNMPQLPPPQRIALQGIAGPPWTAVVSGLPGRADQTVVVVGDTAGNARIRSIRSDTVIIQLGDSTVRIALARSIP